MQSRDSSTSYQEKYWSRKNVTEKERLMKGGVRRSFNIEWLALAFEGDGMGVPPIIIDAHVASFAG